MLCQRSLEQQWTKFPAQYPRNYVHIGGQGEIESKGVEVGVV